VALPAASAPVRITTEHAIASFLVTKEAAVAYATFRKHRTFTKHLQMYGGHKGYVCLDQFRPEDARYVKHGPGKPVGHGVDATTLPACGRRA
jgi:hypothetical protein